MSLLATPLRYGPDGVLDDDVADGSPYTSSPYTIESLFQLRSKPEFPRPKPSGRPRVRFWAQDLEGNGLRMIEGTLDVSTIDAKSLGDGRIEYTLTGHMFPPITQMLVPDEIEDHDHLPVEPLKDGLISSEISVPEGFMPIGRIDPDALRIESSIDYDTRGGRTFKTREETTVKFSTLEFNHAVMDRLFKR